MHKCHARLKADIVSKIIAIQIIWEIRCCPFLYLVYVPSAIWWCLTNDFFAPRSNSGRNSQLSYKPNTAILKLPVLCKVAYKCSRLYNYMNVPRHYGVIICWQYSIYCELVVHPASTADLNHAFMYVSQSTE